MLADREGMAPTGVNRVLVVDDDEITLSLVSFRMQKEGIAVDLARDGVTAIEKLRHIDYGVILLDILMPRLDGFGVLQFIHEDRPHLRHQVIIMTALADQHSPSIDGTFRTIDKPLDYGRLVKAVRECLAQLTQAAPASWYSNEPGIDVN